MEYKMNQKLYSILFCILLSSTFIHDLNAKEPVKLALLPQVFERIADPQLNCKEVCGNNITTPVSANLSILANVKGNLLAVANLTAKAAFIVDVKANLAALLNGTTGGAVVINITTSGVVYIPNGVWLATQMTFSVYLSSLTTGLISLFTRAGTTVYNVTTVPIAILKEVNVVLVFLINNVALDLQDNPLIGLKIIIIISVEMVRLLRGVLNGFLEVAVANSNIRSDLAGTYNTLQGLAVSISKIPGLFPAVSEAGIVHNLPLFLSAPSGLERLIYLLNTAGTKINVGVVWASILNEAEILFRFIAQLGGYENTGITGLFKVLGTIVRFSKGQVQLEVVIAVLIQFLAYTGQTPIENLSATLNSRLRALLKAVEYAEATKGLSGLVTIIKAMLNGTLVVNGVNISLIIKILLNGVYNGVLNLLKVVVAVVLELKALVDPAVALIDCLLVLLFQINSFIGSQILKALGVTVKISLGSKTICYIIKVIIINIITVQSGDIYGYLIIWPVVGNIVRALDAAIKEVTGAKYNLRALVNGSFIFRYKCLAWIWISCPFPSLYISNTTVAAVGATLNTITTLQFYLSINSVITLTV